MASDIQELRSALFETLRELRSTEKPMDVDRAQAVCNTAQTIINSAKLEIDYARVTGLQPGSGFIPTAPLPPPNHPPIVQGEKDDPARQD